MIRRQSQYFSRLGFLTGMIAFCLGIVSVPIFNSLDTSMLLECAGKIPGRHPGECYEVHTADDTFPWERQQAEAREFYREFQRAVAANDREKVSAMMMYPLRVNYFDDARAADYRFLTSPAELTRVYDRVFHQTVKDYIAQVDPNEVWGNDYFLQTGYGQIGFYCTTHGACPSCTFDFKVKIIASNTIYRDATEDILGNPTPQGH